MKIYRLAQKKKKNAKTVLHRCAEKKIVDHRICIV